VHDRIGFREQLTAFRFGLYECFGSWPDTLFEMVDALAGASRPVRSVAELMFEPGVRRGHGSLYQALDHGRIDVARLQDLLAAQVAGPADDDGPLVFAVDTTTYPRPDNRVVDDVGLHYTPDRATNGSPTVPGWKVQCVAQVAGEGLNGPHRSWTLPVDMRRVPVGGNANEIAAAQIADLVARLRAGGHCGAPLFLFDSGYCPIYLTQRLPAGAQLLVRLRTDRVFHGRAQPRQPGQRGRTVKHGRRFKLDDPATWGPPDEQWTHTSGDGASVRVSVWHGYHPEPRQRRKWQGTGIVEGSLIHREHSTPGGHTRAWWLWWAGPVKAFNSVLVADAYQHRFAIEHTYRFLKHDRGWTKHAPLTAEQAERWTWLVLACYAELHLARPLVVDHRLPWEKPCTPAQLSPRRVARAFRRTTAALPSPACAPKSSRPGRGRHKGAKNKHPRGQKSVIKKGRPANTGHPRGKSPRAQSNKP
jgi:DDE superfamily endonuclease